MCGGKKKGGGPPTDDSDKRIKLTGLEAETAVEEILKMFPTALTADIKEGSNECAIIFPTTVDAAKAYEESTLKKVSNMHLEWMSQAKKEEEEAAAVAAAAAAAAEAAKAKAKLSKTLIKPVKPKKSVSKLGTAKTTPTSSKAPSKVKAK